jgi:hypothetical protein
MLQQYFSEAVVVVAVVVQYLGLVVVVGLAMKHIQAFLLCQVMYYLE